MHSLNFSVTSDEFKNLKTSTMLWTALLIHEEEGDEGAECYERIHVCRMMQKLLPGGNIKLFAAVEQVGECQEQTNLIGEGTRMMSRGNAIWNHILFHTQGNPAHGETHGQDGEEPGSEGSAAQEGELTAVDFLHASVAFDNEVVTGIADFPFHIFQRDDVGVIIYQGSSARQGNRGGVDAF